jgi:hypothetical protein
VIGFSENRLMGLGSRERHDMNLTPRTIEARELDLTVDHREQGIVLAQANVPSRKKPGTTLTHQNVAGSHPFTPEALNPETLGIRVAIVLGRGLTLLVSHGKSPMP